MSEEKKKSGSSSRTTEKNTQNSKTSKNAKSSKKVNDDYYYYEEEASKTSSRTSSKKSQKQVPPTEPPPPELKKKEPNPSAVGNQLAVILLVVMALFVLVCFAFRNDVGVLGNGLAYVLFGLFGLGAFLVPFLMLQLAIFWKRDVLSNAIKYKYIVAIFVLLFASVMLHTIYNLVTSVPKVTFATAFTWESLKDLFLGGVEYHGGGFLGGLLANALICTVGYPGTIIFGLLFLVTFAMALFGLTPIECWQRFQFYHHRNRGIRKVKREEAEEKREERAEAEREKREEREKRAKAEREKREHEAAERRRAAEAEGETFARRAREARAGAAASRTQTKSRAENIDSEIFADDADFGAETEAPVAEPVKEPVAKKEKLRPIRAIESEEDKTVKLDEIFDQNEDQDVLSRYAGADHRVSVIDDSGSVAQMELKVERKTLTGTSYAEPSVLDEEDDTPYFVPMKKVKKEEPKPEEKPPQAPIVVRAPEPAPAPKEDPAPIIVQAPTPKKESIPKAEPAQKEDSVSDVISIRPPEMSIPAPATEDDDETFETPKPREYEFPPIDLLQEPPADTKQGDVSAELRENADRIIQTLDSFNVRVSISNVSRGPTITRYEVEPSAGTRVRSIINLLDDIALSLATSGVRSDGIISGKSAIGIEVPNKVTNTVFVRELIEDSRFESAKSKLTASLGMDVSGAPVYLDIAKMPHLLIAGATGQGKSVCINSLIISLLYKARPDEVKLILIDPKKVELNVYNGLPHLLVPVVFDPKKAAGSLHWAVQEMERRFELIEAQHVRNIAQYNAAVADDPLKEKLPQVVIIIDELADLMMSAPDDVETSICRLAQKARAAGMHLIIGTQRPSTDVITGLIKANIPSRIAFTVSNQIDSRIIIDTQGAEKLIGKGDMLFSPVGSSKPVRVQGSFVSETEIENIIDFIKSQSTETTYSDEVIKEIEKNAAACGQKKGKGAASAVSADGGMDDGEEVDPMLDSAIELAVDEGKISTSLIQRRLSLGYGRAAKLIDVMERRGIVSAPEGQKPRKTLLSREQYLEMKMNQTDGASAGEADEPPFDL